MGVESAVAGSRVGEWERMAPGPASLTSSLSWAPLLPFYLIFQESCPFLIFMSLTDSIWLIPPVLLVPTLVWVI